MDFFDVINNRKSVRAYYPKPVADEFLDKIVAAGNAAACANTTKLQFTVITNKNLLASFNAAGIHLMLNSGIKTFIENAQKPGYNVFDGAPVLITVSAPHHDHPLMTAMNVASANCAVQNMLNAATALGLGGCYKALALLGFTQVSVKQACPFDNRHRSSNRPFASPASPTCNKCALL